jgi:hypothetical protein
MKAFVTALTLGLVMAFSAPAFAGSNAMAYVGDMIGNPAPKAAKTKTVESTTTKHHARKHVY